MVLKVCDPSFDIITCRTITVQKYDNACDYFNSNETYYSGLVPSLDRPRCPFKIGTSSFSNLSLATGFLRYYKLFIFFKII